ncbi:hypothetical protein LCGC14_1127270, partial [marine sediment metagenome]
MLHRLDWRHKKIYCNASKHKKKKLAKWYNENIYYCKHCAKQLWKALRKKPELSRKRFKKNRKTVYVRIKELRENPTKSEILFKIKLKRALKVKWQFQRAFIKGGYYAIVDFHI